jgi:galactokinase
MKGFENQRDDFVKYFGKGGHDDVFFSPGRVNIIGEHLDYNGGKVFPAAISLGIRAIVRRRNDRIVRLKSDNFPDEVMVDLDRPIERDRSTAWGNFPIGVIREMLLSGKVIDRGMDALFSSNLPEGAGLSSSASIELLTAYIFSHDEIKTEKDRINLALLCKKVENEFINVQCGIMDQFAIAMGRKDHAILLDTDSLAYDYAPFALGAYRLVIMNTNKQRTLADSKYNERRGQCEKALSIIKKHRKINTLADVSESDLSFLEDHVLLKRARHVVTESRRVSDAIVSLKEKDLTAFGRQMTASHFSLQNDYEVSGLHLDALVESALEVDGCLGARMTGAGFGGCAIAVVEKNAFDDFMNHVGIKYSERTGLKADFFITDVSNGVERIS